MGRSSPGGQNRSMTAVEADIRSILARLQDAVAAKDLHALSALLDQEVVLFGTAVANLDRSESTAYLSRVIEAVDIIRWEWDDVVPLVVEPGLLAFAALGSVGSENSDGRPVGRRDAFRLSIIAVDRGDGWRLRHFHGSVPQ